jgi:polysaccharide pyruvyl transferase WcaK-like protein
MPARLPSATVLDTSIATRNIGDEIIMDAVRGELRAMLPEAAVRTVPTHERLGARTRGLIGAADIVLAGGSNLIGPPMYYSRLWKVTPWDALQRWDVTLMGCGWRRYSARISPATAWLLRRLLGSEVPHAVRDHYTAEQLAKLGIDNTLVTGCPTTWGLDTALLGRIPQQQGDEVVVVLNGRNDAPGLGQAILAACTRRYRKVHFWTQMFTDARYLQGLDAAVEVVPPNLQAYDELLRGSESLDYVGTRLHAGVRALQHGRRTTIFEIDNRAAEMSKTLSLPTVAVERGADVDQALAQPWSAEVEIPADTVDQWRRHVRAHVLPDTATGGGAA